MKTDHTPEPWITGEPYGPLMTEILNEDSSKVIAVVFTHRHASWPSNSHRSQVEQSAEGQANLALIKAAPKLLRVCQALLPLAEHEAGALDDIAHTSPEADAASLEAWAIIDAAEHVIKEATS